MILEVVVGVLDAPDLVDIVDKVSEPPCKKTKETTRDEKVIAAVGKHLPEFLEVTRKLWVLGQTRPVAEKHGIGAW